MIKTREEYLEFIKRDAAANWRSSTLPKIFGDHGWSSYAHSEKKNIMKMLI